MNPRREEHEIMVGFAGNAKKIKVKVDDRDLRPWDLETKFQTVGTDQARADGVAKVTGRARYAYDINLPGLLHGLIVRAPIAKGTLKALDLEAAKAMPGVKAVLATKQPGARIRFAGDDVAAIAAETLDAARDAAEKVRMEFTAEPHVTDVLEAPGAPKLDQDGEVTAPWPERGADRIETAIQAARHVRSATYRCEVQTHSSLETHGLTARWYGDRLTVWASTQATFGTRAGLAGTLRIPAENITVHTEFMGGGFGSKFQPGIEGVLACRLAKAADAPVKLMLSRHEEHTCAGNRPGAIIQIRAGVNDDGKITAFDYRCWGEPGFTGQGGGTRAPSDYFRDTARRDTQDNVATDMDAGRAMRAPGWPQGFFATELMLDELAAAIGMDPLEFRLKNDRNEVRLAEWRQGAEAFRWAERRNKTPGQPRAGGDPRWLHGCGLSSAAWGGMGGPGARVTCRIHADARVEVRNGAQDLGTGLKTVLQMLAAEELGIPVAMVTPFVGDTRDPVGPASGGSVTTPTMAPAVRHAAALARRELAARVAEKLGVDAAKVACAGGQVTVEGGQTLSFVDACKLLGSDTVEVVGERFPNHQGYANSVAGCQFAEVRVDRHTGLVQVLDMLAVQDCGTVVARKQAESQTLGAMIQGVSYALHEQRIVDHLTGRMVNGDFLYYKLTGPLDMPAMRAILFPVANGHTNVGAAGIGEPVAVAPAAAIANAVFNAIGVPVRHLPLTPDKILKALARARRV